MSSFKIGCHPASHSWFSDLTKDRSGSRTDDPMPSRNVCCSLREQTIGLLPRSASFGRSGPSSLLLAGLFWHDSPHEARVQQAGLRRVRRTQFRPPHPRTRCDIIGWDIGFLHPPMTRLTVALGRAHWFRTGRLALGRGRLLKGKHQVFVDFISTDDINAGGRFDCRGFVEVFTSRVARQEGFEHAIYHLIAGRNGRVDSEIPVYDAVESEAPPVADSTLGSASKSCMRAASFPRRRYMSLTPLGAERPIWFSLPSS